MKKFSQYLKDVELKEINDDDREFIYRFLARFSHFGPKQIEYTKDMLLQLQQLVDDKLTGA